MRTKNKGSEPRERLNSLQNNIDVNNSTQSRKIVPIDSLRRQLINIADTISNQSYCLMPIGLIIETSLNAISKLRKEHKA